MGDHDQTSRVSRLAAGTPVPALRSDATFVVIVADPMTGEVDAFGPFTEKIARGEVGRRRGELDAEGLVDVVVTSVVLTPPAERRSA